MHPSIATLVLAVYPDRATATQDLHAVREHRGGDIDVVYAALVAKDSTGHVSSELTFLPAAPDRSEETLRLVGRFHRGLTRSDIREIGGLLDRSSVAIIAVLSGSDIQGVLDLLQTDEIMVDQVTSDDVAFNGLLRAYNGIGDNQFNR